MIKSTWVIDDYGFLMVRPAEKQILHKEGIFTEFHKAFRIWHGFVDDFEHLVDLLDLIDICVFL